MISLGIICYQGHSSAVCLIQDGLILSAVAEERFSRLKNDDSFPALSIEFVLKENKFSFSQIDEVGFAWSPKLTILGQLKNLSLSSFRFIFDIRNGGKRRSRFSKFLLMLNIKSEIKKRYAYDGKITFLDHHYCHALSAYIHSQKSDALVFVADGMGEYRSTTLYEFKQNKYRLIYQDNFPHSLGIFYSAGTQALGFKPDSDEFKVMGLAAYGKSDKYISLLEKLYFFENGHFKLDLTFFEIHKKGNMFYSEKYKGLFNSLEAFQDKADFSLALQNILEKIVFTIVKNNKDKFSSKNFASSGGVFLNCLLNQKIRESKLFDSFTFFPVADDNGTSIGAAQALQLKNNIQLTTFNNLYLGPNIIFDKNLIPSNILFRKLDNFAEVAELLAKGKVIGWVQGNMEFGHRALGARSILADPRKAEMKNIVNQKIKFREEYRPFAPAILEEKLNTFFKVGKVNYSYMIETAEAFLLTKNLAPAIVHVDGTSRVQSVSRKDNAILYDLINEFYTLTDCPMLINTSFNLNGMPIVNSLSDILDCFLMTDLDYIVVDNYILNKCHI